MCTLFSVVWSTSICPPVPFISRTYMLIPTRSTILYLCDDIITIYFTHICVDHVCLLKIVTISANLINHPHYTFRDGKTFQITDFFQVNVYSEIYVNRGHIRFSLLLISIFSFSVREIQNNDVHISFFFKENLYVSRFCSWAFGRNIISSFFTQTELSKE